MEHWKKDFQNFDWHSGHPISGIILCSINIVFQFFLLQMKEISAEYGINETNIKWHFKWHVPHKCTVLYILTCLLLRFKKKNNLSLHVIFTFVPDGINASFNNTFKRFYICDDRGICIKKPKLKKKIWNWDF